MGKRKGPKTTTTTTTMTASALSPAEKDSPLIVRYDRQLQWVSLPATTKTKTTKAKATSTTSSPTLWWPSLMFDNYGDILKADMDEYHDDQLYLAEQAVTTMNEGKVALAIGMSDTSPKTKRYIYEPEETLDFYRYLGDIVQQATPQTYGKALCKSFRQAVQLAVQYLKEESKQVRKGGVCHSNNNSNNNNSVRRTVVHEEESEEEEQLLQEEEEEEEESVQEEEDDDESSQEEEEEPEEEEEDAPATPMSADSDDRSHEIEESPIHAHDKWDTAWGKMRLSGWKITADRNNDFESVYIKPDCYFNGGVEGVDYFRTEQDVRNYARRHYQWRGEREKETDEQQPHQQKKQQHTQPKSKRKVVAKKPPKKKPSSTKAPAVSKKQITTAHARKRKKTSSAAAACTKNKNLASYKRSREIREEKEDFYNFGSLWFILKQVGWTYKPNPSQLGPTWVYLRPDKDLKTGVEGEDYFVGEDALVVYAKANNLKEELKSPSPAPRKKLTKKSKPVSTSTSDVPATPTDCQTKPQDPGKPIPPTPAPSSSEESVTPFKDVWNRLRRCGWRWAKHTLHNMVYLRPGREIKGGKLGVDFFLGPQEVLDYLKKEDDRMSMTTTTKKRPRDNNDNERPASLFSSSPVTRDMEREALSTGCKADNESLIAATRATKDYDDNDTISSCSPPKSRRIDYRNNNWWTSEAVPSFINDIWPLLRDKLNFGYGGGQYLMPGPVKGRRRFALDQDMRRYLCENGIPCIQTLTEKEKERLFRWVTFANVPVSATNSTSRLKGVPLLNNKDAWDLLSSKSIGFVKVAGQYFVSLDAAKNKHSIPMMDRFDNLEEVRFFLRAKESLRPKTSGRSRGRNVDKLSDDETLCLRLWAAASAIPLPVHPAPAVAAVPDKKDETAVSIASSPPSLLATQEEEANVPASVASSPRSTRSHTDSIVKPSTIWTTTDNNSHDDDDGKYCASTKRDVRRITMDPSDMEQAQNHAATPPAKAAVEPTHNAGIREDDDWKTVYGKMMKDGGWTYKTGYGLYEFIFMPPHGKSPHKGGKPNVDFYHQESELKLYAVRNYGWNGREKNTSSSGQELLEAARKARGQ